MLYSTKKIIITRCSWMGCSTQKIIIKYGNRLVLHGNILQVTSDSAVLPFITSDNRQCRIAIYYKWQPTGPYCHLLHVISDLTICLFISCDSRSWCIQVMTYSNQPIVLYASYNMWQPNVLFVTSNMWQPSVLYDYLLHVTTDWLYGLWIHTTTDLVVWLFLTCY